MEIFDTVTVTVNPNSYSEVEQTIIKNILQYDLCPSKRVRFRDHFRRIEYIQYIQMYIKCMHGGVERGIQIRFERVRKKERKERERAKEPKRIAQEDCVYFYV